MMDWKEAKGLVDLGDCSLADLEANEECIAAGKRVSIERPRCVLWFLPVVTHALKGGVRTVFTFAEELTKKHGTLNVFVIYSFSGRDFDGESLEQSLVTHFPDLRFVLKKHLNGVSRVEELPRSQIAICTLWTTAYLLLQYNKTYRKFYLMQDFEPMFYEGGDVYAVIEQTYRFGFSCIANTAGVANKYLQYSDDVRYFTPGVDHNTFFPSEQARSDGRPYKIVLYGRPNARNCFVLGIETLKRVKDELVDEVEIVSVGAEWSPHDFGLEGVLENLGLLPSMSAVADLYRECDMGLVFMATPHPSYQPLEYMASGCVVATNLNQGTQWLLNADNCLLLEPTPRIASTRIVSVLQDAAKMRQLRENGSRSVACFSWEQAFDAFERALSV